MKLEQCLTLFVSRSLFPIYCLDTEVKYKQIKFIRWFVWLLTFCSWSQGVLRGGEKRNDYTILV
jgi:hypothetical protein